MPVMKLAVALALRKSLDQKVGPGGLLFEARPQIVTLRLTKAEGTEEKHQAALAALPSPSTALREALLTLGALARVERIVNEANAATTTGLVPLSVLLVNRQLCKQMLAVLRSAEPGTSNGRRTSAGEAYDDYVLSLPRAKPEELKTSINRVSAKLRETDVEIQRLNWEIDVEIPDWIVALDNGTLDNSVALPPELTLLII
jgi:hypothetical protein